MKNEVTTTQKAIAAANRKQKMKKNMTKAMFSLMSVAMLANSVMLTVFAADAVNENTNADITTTGTMDKMVALVFWIIRGVILISGGGPALIKIVQGQTDENPRDRNAGIVALVITGVVFAASFVIEALL